MDDGGRHLQISISGSNTTAVKVRRAKGTWGPLSQRTDGIEGQPRSLIDEYSKCRPLSVDLEDSFKVHMVGDVFVMENRGARKLAARPVPDEADKGP